MASGVESRAEGTPPHLVLASASPRRRELLAAAGLRFEIVVPDVDESLPERIEPASAACLLAQRKARAVAARWARRDGCVLAADTIVAVARGAETELCGKPADDVEAREMLGRLSATRHQVVTGVCALRLADGREAVDFERTWVTMRRLAPHEIEDYVASGEWRDKAGGYAIQESADRFVTGLDGGGFDNVVGLPVRLALRLLAELGCACGQK